MSDTPTPTDPPGSHEPDATEPGPPAPSTTAERQPMTVRGVLGQALSLYSRFFVRFFTLALAVFLVLNLITALAAALLFDGSSGAALVGAISIAVVIVGTFWLQGALVFAVQDIRDGSADESIGDLLRKATPYLGALVGAGILAGLGIAVGLLLLVIPGVYLLTIWAVIAPSIVLEGAGVMESFGRSRSLVSGRFWPVLGVVVVAAILAGIAQNVVSLILSFLPTFLQYWLGGAVASAVAAPFMALAITLTYFALRDEKEAQAA